MIGPFLYPIASRPYIMFVLCLGVRFQASLKESHLNAVKCILRHLTGTQQIGLWYPKRVDCDLVNTPIMISLGANSIEKVQAVHLTYT